MDEQTEILVSNIGDLVLSTLISISFSISILVPPSSPRSFPPLMCFCDIFYEKFVQESFIGEELNGGIVFKSALAFRHEQHFHQLGPTGPSWS